MIRKFGIVKVGDKYGAVMKALWFKPVYLDKSGDAWYDKISFFERCSFDTQEDAERTLIKYLSLDDPIFIKEVK